MQWKCRDKTIDLHQPPLRAAVMGIVNLTPDSFSDGGMLSDAQAAAEHILAMARLGCAVADIGGQSTRPGHTAISHEEEWRRIRPTLELLRAMRGEGIPLPLISVDTYYPEVAQAALEHGADIINDVTGFAHPDMRRIAAEYGAGCVIMHSGDITGCGDPVSAVREFFARRVEQCVNDGIDRRCICLDCGIGFGKTREQEVELLRRMGECRVEGLPLLAAASRKRVIAHMMGIDLPPHERDEATHATHLTAVKAGADMVRVHDAEGACASLKIE